MELDRINLTTPIITLTVEDQEVIMDEISSPADTCIALSDKAIQNDPKFKCTECIKRYSNFRTLRQHVSKCHPDKLNDLITPGKRNKIFEFKCDSCNRNFNKITSLNYHKRQVHSEGEKQIYKKTVKCPICETDVKKNKYFEHCHLFHDTEINIEHLQFSSKESFQEWKDGMEKSTFSKYVLERGIQKKRNNIFSQLYSCHRSGYYQSESEGRRHLKTQGSSKINAYCPSQLEVRLERDVYYVTFVKNHIGHHKDIGHLHLTDSERKIIASKIAQKIPFEAILDEIRDSITNSELKRIHLLTMQDLYNIENCFNLNNTAVRHQNDAMSVEAWVNQTREGENPCVLLYKPQGVVSNDFPGLQEDDFVLIIMNQAQSEILQKFGEDCICIDGTHGMNSYNFELHTILVLDDMRQGFPCAFLITSRSDEAVLSLFFACVRDKVGILKPKVLMSDMAPIYFNAWVAEMPAPEMRLYCTWHVDQAWQRNLKKIKSQVKQVDTYKLLRSLLQELDKDSFNNMLQQAVENLLTDPDTFEFGTYFRDHYVKNATAWAYCYRLNSGLNTNNHIENMHRSLKHIYLHGKCVKRLDKAIHAILAFVRNKLIDRLIVKNKGKLTNKLKDIRNRHATSLQLNVSVIEVEHGWQVQSEQGFDIYEVIDNKCECMCQLVCVDCNVCKHRFSCNCMDAAIHDNMCKHIHFVCRNRIQQDENSCLEKDQELNLVTETCEDEVIVTQLMNKYNDESDVKKRVEKLQNKMNNIFSKVKSVKQIEALEKLFAPAEPLLQAIEESDNISLPSTSASVPPNTKIVQQRRFHSTKKTKEKAKKVLTKPTKSEMEHISLGLILSSKNNFSVE